MRLQSCWRRLPGKRNRSDHHCESMSARFTKFHGYGNDYIVFEAKQLAEAGDLTSFARRICNRHYGAGADGIAIARQSEDTNSHFQVRIFNPDASQAGMSGNDTP